MTLAAGSKFGPYEIAAPMAERISQGPRRLPEVSAIWGWIFPLGTPILLLSIDSTASR